MHHPTDRIAHSTAFDTPVMVHWLEQEMGYESSYVWHLIANRGIRRCQLLGGGGGGDYEVTFEHFKKSIVLELWDGWCPSLIPLHF